MRILLKTVFSLALFLTMMSPVNPITTSQSNVTTIESTPKMSAVLPEISIEAQIETGIFFKIVKFGEALDYRLRFHRIDDDTWTTVDYRFLYTTDTASYPFYFFGSDLAYSSSYTVEVCAVIDGVQSEWSTPLSINVPENPVTGKLVTNLKATVSNYNTVTLSWTAAERAVSYKVMYTIGSISYSMIDVSGTSVVFNNLLFGTNYDFEVFSVLADGSTFNTSVSVRALTANNPVGQTSAITYVSGDADTITMSWAAVSGASSYEITLKEYGVASPKTFTRTITGLTSTFDGLSASRMYTFSVTAFKTINGIRYRGVTSEYYTLLRTRLGLTVSSIFSWAPYAITVNWESVPQTLAEVCISTSATTGFSCYYSDDIHGGMNSYHFYVYPGIMYNTTYYVKIRSFYYDVNKVRIYGAYSPVVSVKTILEKPEISVSTYSFDTIKINWKFMNSASKYLLYRSTSVDGTYTLIKTTGPDGTTVYDSPVNVGTVYYYKMRTYNSTTGAYSAYSDVVSGISSFLPPSSITATSLTATSLQIDFKAAGGATGYQAEYAIYDPLAETPNWISATIEGTHFVVSDLVMGQYVQFRIRSTRIANGQIVLSDSDAVGSAQMLPPIPVLSRTSNYNTVTVSWPAIQGVDGYELFYIDTTKTMNWTVLQDSADTQFVHNNVITGRGLYYKARSYTLVDGQRLYSDYSEVISVQPNMTAPKVSITAFSPSTISMAWDAVGGARGYVIYQASSATGRYLQVGTTTDLSFTKTGLSTNLTYYFQVVPYFIDPEWSYQFDGPSSATVSAKTIPATATAKANYTNYNTNMIAWEAINGASGYEVAMSIGTSATYTLIKTQTTLSFVHTGLITGTKYNYKVRAYKLVGTVKVYGAYSAVASSTPYPLVPVLSVNSAEYNAIKATWSPVTGATGYEVSFSSNENGPYTVMPLVTTTSLVIRDLTLNQPYYVKIRAYRLIGTVKHFSASSAVFSATPIPATPVVTGNSGGYDHVHLSWPAILGATAYEVSVLNPSSKLYEVLRETVEPSFVDELLITGTPRTYQVRAYVTSGETRVYGVSSSSVTVTPIPELVTGLTVSKADVFSIDLVWNPVNGANGYEISRSTTLNGVYTVIANGDLNLVYKDAALNFNTSYFYKIKAYTLVGETKVYGNSTPALSTKTALSPVSGPKAEYLAYNSNKITWSAVNGATGYEIYRSTGTSTSYAYLTALTATTYTNTGLYTNTKYNYKIRAYRLVGTTKVYGAYSTIVSATPLPWAPTITVNSSSNTTLKVTWPVVAGANGYEVSYATSETGTYTKLALVTTNSASITKLLTNTTYYVKVRAYRIVNYVKIYGASSTIITGTPIPSTPLVTAVSAGYGSAKISWGAITGASGYEVYLQSNESPEYFLAADVTTLTTTVARMMTGASYNVKVRAYQIVNSVRVYSLDSAVKAVTPIPSTVTGFKVAMPSVTSLKLSWTAVEGATGYEVFKATSSTGTYVSLGTVEGSTEFIVTGLTFNTSTYYKVRAYTTVGSTKVYGVNTAVLTGKTMPSTVQLSVSNPSYNSNALSWPAIEGATGYEIYVSTGTSTYYTLLKALTTTSFTHASLAFNSQYNYKVRAYKLVGTVKYYGAYSTLTSIKTAVSAPSAIVNSTHDSISLTWNAVTGASGYEVSIATSLTGPYTVTTQTTVSKVFSGLTTGTTYYIKLRSYRLVSTTKVYGPYANGITVTPSLNVPVIQLSELTLNTATFTWAPVDGATDYEVRLISDAVDAQWVTENVSELTVTFEDLDHLAHYTVEIRAAKKIADVSVYSETSSPFVFSYSDTN